MAKLHFVSTDLPLNHKERCEFAGSIEQGLAANGRPGDQVIVLVQATWLGCIDMEDSNGTA